MPRTDPYRFIDPLRATRLVRETARLIGCGEVAVVEMIRDGRLQAVQVGNRQQPTVASIERLFVKTIAELEHALHATTSQPAT